MTCLPRKPPASFIAIAKGRAPPFRTGFIWAARYTWGLGSVAALLVRLHVLNTSHAGACHAFPGTKPADHPMSWLYGRQIDYCRGAEAPLVSVLIAYHARDFNLHSILPACAFPVGAQAGLSGYCHCAVCHRACGHD